MAGLVEAKPQRWRALAIYSDGRECLLYVGPNFAQVNDHYDEPYFELLDDEERKLVSRIYLQKWIGAADSGSWQTQRNLPIPATSILPIAKKVSQSA